MTGFRSMHLRHQCPADGCYIEKLPWWDDFFSAFPRGIRATDVDGFIEMNGHFLFMEEKGRGVPFGNNAGQFKALKALADHPGFTVLFLRPGAAADYDFLVHDGSPEPRIAQCSKGQLIAWLKRWADRADGQAAA